MKQRIAIFIAIAGLGGFAGWFVLQKLGQQEAAVPVAVTPAPAAPTVDVAALKTKADAGDPAAQTSLGWAYQKGTGVKPDMKAAYKLFQLAASQNYPDALAALGEMNQAGQGTHVNLPEAVRLYRLAAERGSVAGQYNLAYLYEQGSGVTKSEPDAAKWYELAAQGGDEIAQYDIGQRYMLGVGVQTNRVQALKWLTLAASQGQSDASPLITELAAKMTGDELANAKRLADQFAAHPVAMTNVAPAVTSSN